MRRLLRDFFDFFVPRFVTEEVYLRIADSKIDDIVPVEMIKRMYLIHPNYFSHIGVSRCFSFLGFGFFARINNIQPLGD